MKYGFRLRFRLGRVRISTSDTVLHLADPRTSGETVRMATAKTDEPITDSQDLQVSGKYYESGEAASTAAVRWQGIVEKALARNKIGANFGLRHTPGATIFSGALIADVEEAAGTQVLTDRLGITVFEEEPEPMFLAASLDGYPGRLPEQVLAAIKAADEGDILIEESREKLAYELYSASFSVSYPDARFILLMMAMETLIQQQVRSPEPLAHLDRLIADTAASGLDNGEIDSLTRSLAQLKLESVGKAGRRLVKQKLEGRSYREQAPQSFFQACYELRSRLVHGDEDRPSGTEIDEYAVVLEVMLTDLLGLGLPEPA